MSKRLIPAMGRVLVEALPEAETSEGGIHLVKSQSVSSTVGRIIEESEPYISAFDDKDEYSPQGPRYKKSDIVVFGKYTGTQITIQRRTFILMNESDILGKLVDEETKTDG